MLGAILPSMGASMRIFRRLAVVIVAAMAAAGAMQADAATLAEAGTRADLAVKAAEAAQASVAEAQAKLEALRSEDFSSDRDPAVIAARAESKRAFEALNAAMAAESEAKSAFGADSAEYKAAMEQRQAAAQTYNDAQVKTNDATRAVADRQVAAWRQAEESLNDAYRKQVDANRQAIAALKDFDAAWKSSDAKSPDDLKLGAAIKQAERNLTGSPNGRAAFEAGTADTALRVKAYDIALSTPAGPDRQAALKALVMEAVAAADEGDDRSASMAIQSIRDGVLGAALERLEGSEDFDAAIRAADAELKQPGGKDGGKKTASDKVRDDVRQQAGASREKIQTTFDTAVDRLTANCGSASSCAAVLKSIIADAGKLGLSADAVRDIIDEASEDDDTNKMIASVLGNSGYGWPENNSYFSAMKASFQGAGNDPDEKGGDEGGGSDGADSGKLAGDLLGKKSSASPE